MISQNCHFLCVFIFRPLWALILAQKWLQIIYFGRKRASKVVNWDTKGRPEGSWTLLWGSFWQPWERLEASWCLSGAPLDCRRGARALRDSIFCDFLWFYQAKVQFLKKNINFTCIRAMLGVCYAGKSPIFKKKHKFYLHNRHL